ncbi:spore protein [Halalkalibacter alkalisediminis]|uniref:Spore protein n=1 Tax=Halalkalibacter alkalisediminis TaxID=935616 RepID=A0ABV6NGN2_9BACI|nr:spore protein [Halalkalibacter alkalisediminis]
MNQNNKQQTEGNTHDKTKQQRKEGYTGDKKLGGPNRPAE